VFCYLRANVHITDVSRGTKEHKTTYFLPNTTPLWLLSFTLLFVIWSLNAIENDPYVHCVLLLASLSRYLLWKHNSKILKTLYSTPAFFVSKLGVKSFQWIWAALRNLCHDLWFNQSWKSCCEFQLRAEIHISADIQALPYYCN